MKNLKWVILIVVAFLLGWYVAEMRQPPVEEPSAPEPDVQKEPSVFTKPPEWSEIVVKATYVNDGLSFQDQGPHDTAVVGPGDVIKWRVECTGCPTESSTHSVLDVKRIAKLPKVGEAVMALFLNPQEPFATREDLGLVNGVVGSIDDVMETDFFGVPFAFNKLIEGKVRDEVDPEVAIDKGELWKFTYEVCVCLVPEDGGCAKGKLQCKKYDPHIWAHEKKA